MALMRAAIVLVSTAAMLTACAAALHAQSGANRAVILGIALECEQCAPASQLPSGAVIWTYSRPPRVAAIAAGSAAAAAGVQVGDSLVAIDGLRMIEGSGPRRLAEVRAPERVRLTLRRGGQTVELVASLGIIPPPAERDVCTAGATIGRDRVSIESRRDSLRGVPRLDIGWRAGQCAIVLRVQGAVTLRPDLTDVVDIAPGAVFRASIRDKTTRRDLTISRLATAPTYEWRVDGTRQPWNETARQSVSDLLVALDRRTAFAIDLRFPLLMANGGTEAILAEIAQMREDFALSRYALRLVGLRDVRTDAIATLLGDVIPRMAVDAERERLLVAIAANPAFGDEHVRSAFARSAATIRFDPTRWRVLSALLVDGPVPVSVAEAILKAAMPSARRGPGYPRFLAGVIDAKAIPTSVLPMLIEAVASVPVDRSRADLLVRVAREYRLSDPARAAYRRAAATIPAIHRARVLQALLDGPTP